MACPSSIYRITHERNGLYRISHVRYQIRDWAFAWLAGVVCAIWAAGALYFDFPTARAAAAILFQDPDFSRLIRSDLS
jgi:succinate dehydrogenase hydrophobic anchor subunit